MGDTEGSGVECRRRRWRTCSTKNVVPRAWAVLAGVGARGGFEIACPPRSPQAHEQCRPPPGSLEQPARTPARPHLQVLNAPELQVLQVQHAVDGGRGEVAAPPHHAVQHPRAHAPRPVGVKLVVRRLLAATATTAQRTEHGGARGRGGGPAWRWSRVWRVGTARRGGALWWAGSRVNGGGPGPGQRALLRCNECAYVWRATAARKYELRLSMDNLPSGS